MIWFPRQSFPVYCSSFRIRRHSNRQSADRNSPCLENHHLFYHKSIELCWKNCYKNTPAILQDQGQDHQLSNSPGLWFQWYLNFSDHRGRFTALYLNGWEQDQAFCPVRRSNLKKCYRISECFACQEPEKYSFENTSGFRCTAFQILFYQVSSCSDLQNCPYSFHLVPWEIRQVISTVNPDRHISAIRIPMACQESS